MKTATGVGVRVAAIGLAVSVRTSSELGLAGCNAPAMPTETPPTPTPPMEQPVLAPASSTDTTSPKRKH
jgi:hypothetical protein